MHVIQRQEIVKSWIQQCHCFVFLLCLLLRDCRSVCLSCSDANGRHTNTAGQRLSESTIFDVTKNPTLPKGSGFTVMSHCCKCSVLKVTYGMGQHFVWQWFSTAVSFKNPTHSRHSNNETEGLNSALYMNDPLWYYFS
jgi:hypothetical protein